MDDQRHHHKAGNLERKIGMLDGEERKRALPPGRLLDMVSVGKADDVLDLGAGTGFLAIPAAGRTGGTVYALDMDGDMLGLIGEKAEAAGIGNIRLVRGNIARIPLADECVDIAIASMVLHEVKPLEEALREIGRVLKPGGRLLCLEYEKKESADGPPVEIRIPLAEMERALESAGFRVAGKAFPQDYAYALVAEKE